MSQAKEESDSELSGLDEEEELAMMKASKEKAQTDSKESATPASEPAPLEQQRADVLATMGVSPMDDAKNRSEWDKKVVPTGGQRVPKGMEADADWRNMPEVAPEPEKSYGPEYDKIKAKREALDHFKKSMAGVGKVVAIFVGEEKGSTKYQSLEAKRVKAIKVLQDAMADLSEEHKRLGQNVIAKSTEKEIWDKEAYYSFQEVINKSSQKVFGEMKKLLGDLKAAKQAYIKAHP